MFTVKKKTNFKVGGVYTTGYSYFFIAFIDEDNKAYLVNINEKPGISNQEINEICEKCFEDENKIEIYKDDFDYLNSYMISDGYLGQIDEDILKKMKKFINKVWR